MLRRVALWANPCALPRVARQSMLLPAVVVANAMATAMGTELTVQCARGVQLRVELSTHLIDEIIWNQEVFKYLPEQVPA